VKTLGEAGSLAHLRPLVAADFDGARALYVDLVGDIPVPVGTAGKTRFAQILSHPGTAIWGAEHDGRIVAMATLHVIPNMTFGGRAYAIVENVVTLQAYRGQGFGASVMQAVVKAAWAADAYKVMLLTGKTLGAKGFYEKLGFTDQDKYGMTIRRAPARQPRD
jgi:GNAT superfamily N-acetyltransferase